MTMKPSIFVGDMFDTKHGCVKVIEYTDRNKILVEFEDGWLARTSGYKLRRGEVKNPNFPTAYGVGYFGIGSYRSEDENGKRCVEYDMWRGMLRRVYDAKFQVTHQSYVGCDVDTRWHDYQCFAEYFHTSNYYEEGWHLDKDVLVKGNKTYSPERCVFLPPCLNALLLKTEGKRGKYLIGVSRVDRLNKFSVHMQFFGQTKHFGFYNSEVEAFNVYKVVKEEYIKQQANKWRDKIDPRAYNALMNYQVEITD